MIALHQVNVGDGEIRMARIVDLLAKVGALIVTQPRIRAVEQHVLSLAFAGATLAPDAWSVLVPVDPLLKVKPQPRHIDVGYGSHAAIEVGGGDSVVDQMVSKRWNLEALVVDLCSWKSFVLYPPLHAACLLHPLTPKEPQCEKPACVRQGPLPGRRNGPVWIRVA